MGPGIGIGTNFNRQLSGAGAEIDVLALQGDGTEYGVGTNHYSQIQGNNKDISAGGWFRSGSLAGTYIMVQMRRSNNDNVFYISKQPTTRRLQVLYKDDVGDFKRFTTTASFNNPTTPISFLANINPGGATDADKIGLHIDGVLAAGTYDGASTSDSINTLGDGFDVFGFDTIQPFTGVLNELWISNSLRTAPEIAEHHNGGIALNLNDLSFKSSMLGGWRMGDDLLDTNLHLQDQISTNHMTLTGFEPEDIVNW